MKLPFTIDLRNPGAKQVVDDCISRHGKNKAINEVGLSVQCVDDAGNAFEILQFNSSRYLARFSAAAPVPTGASA